MDNIEQKQEISETPSVYVGIDVGGTFTDLVVFNSDSLDLRVLKVSTTSHEPEKAILQSLDEMIDNPAKVALINHATTIATNALLTHAGLAKTALITNKGFRDILEIGRQRRPEVYNLAVIRPPSLVSRKHRFVVRGRILSDGRELEPLSIKEAKVITKKITRDNFEAVAISFLNSYTNANQEKKMESILRRYGKFRGHVSISSKIDPQYREYERTSTTVVNASLAPLVSSYLRSLKAQLEKRRFHCSLYIMNSDGNVSTAINTSEYPISAIESGPAAGVLASRFLAKLLSLERVLTFDMGGTTAKAGTIANYQPDISYEFEAAGKTHSGRSVKGSGYPVRFPFIDLAEVSAGGGTIAFVDEGGGLRVGPQSAGAVPGPACYGGGGTLPTVTDANIVLGRLNQEYLLGGKMRINSDLSTEALRVHIADKLGIDVESAAQGIIKLVNNSMAKALSIVSVERGRDPRDYSLIAFGGAGPLHACELADELNINRVILPPHPGLFSAYGLMTVDLARTFSKSILTTNLHLEEELEKFRQEVLSALKSEESLEGGRFVLQEFVDMRYEGQSYEITLPYRGPQSDLRAQFDSSHETLYGYASLEEPVEIVNIRIKAVVEMPKIERKSEKADWQGMDGLSPNPIPFSRRRAWISSTTSDVPIYIRERLNAGAIGKGPCIIEEYDSTSVVGADWTWNVDGYLNLQLKKV